MIRRLLLPLLALGGLALGVYMMVTTTKAAPKAVPVVEPSRAPFAAYVAGTGLIEASTENVKVGTPSGGLVTKVYVQVGDRVKRGQPLWQMDDGPKRAEVTRYEAAVASAEAALAKLRQGTRSEEVAKQQAQVAQTTVQLEDARMQLRLREAAAREEARAVSQDELNQARNTVRQRESALAYQQAELVRLQAGTWPPEIRVQEAEVEQARAQYRQAQVDLERLTIRSPFEGDVLQVKIHEGEYAPAAQTDDGLMTLGNHDVMVVRADVDEQDAWRVTPDQPAVAYPRGRNDVKIALSFARVEPYVIPKKSLTGESTERVDTRVLQVLYQFHQPKDFQLYVGLQMDVYIQAAPLPDSGAKSTAQGPAVGGQR